ncbi:MAG TPA: pyridoxine 5'-phosphate synthase [Methylomirabilota bacterium]|nr:pyridoxine 5'-phosphate synthase [Methylomirabilota bacterium]
MPGTELSVNVDHVATLRQARGGGKPDPVEAAVLALDAGATGITVHLREDRRHIQDADVTRLRGLDRCVLNLEMAVTSEILSVAESVKPERATFVPERRQELTTEGGLDLKRHAAGVKAACARLKKSGIIVSLFLDPDPDTIRAAGETGAEIVEIHTGAYANSWGTPAAEKELRRIQEAAVELERLGIKPHAGHGLDVENVGPLLRAYPFTELSIGHSIVSRSVLVGMKAAVREMIEAFFSA